MTVIYNWCSEWLIFIPNPPITVLSRIEHIAREMGGSAPLEVAWPALRSFFGEVSKTDAALILLDNILASKPPFIEYLVASYCLLTNGNEINSSNVRYVINRARQFYEKNWKENHNQTSFNPLPEGHYPILPIIESEQLWKQKELQRIRDEAEAMKNETELSIEIKKEETLINRKTKSWLRQRQSLLETEAEQMREYQRKERESLDRENLKQREEIEERRRILANREIEEENVFTEWKEGSRKAIEETKDRTDMIVQKWIKWLDLKEEEALLSKEEVDCEMKILKRREEFQFDELTEQKKAVKETTELENKYVTSSLKRYQELKTATKDYSETFRNLNRKIKPIKK